MTGGAGYIGSHAAKALHARRLPRRRLRQPRRRATARRCSTAIWSRATSPTSRRCATRCARTTSRRSCTSRRFLDVGESVREPARYYRNNVVGALSVLEAMAAESVHAFRVLVDVRHLRRADRDADRRDASAAADQQLRRDQAGRRARAAALRARATACHSVALRYFNAAGADPDGEIGEDHSPEIHLIPRAIEAAHRRTGPAGLRRRLPDARRHLPARLHPRRPISRDAHVRALEAHRRDRASPAPTISARAVRIRCAKSSTPSSE